MGYWLCDDGIKVEMFIDDVGNFAGFGDGVTEEDIEKVNKEFREMNKEWLERRKNHEE